MIKIDYENTIRKANDLNDYSAQCRDHASSIQNRLISHLDSFWKGSAANAARERLVLFAAELRSAGNELSAISSRIKATANAIKEADEEAAKNNMQ